MRISDWSSDVCSSDLPVRFQTQTRGSILVGPSAPHRLVEDRSQHLEIMQCGVARGCSNAIAGRLLTPFNKRYDVFAAHLLGPLNLSILEECGDRMTRFLVFRKSQRRVQVTNLKPFRSEERREGKGCVSTYR